MGTLLPSSIVRARPYAGAHQSSYWLRIARPAEDEALKTLSGSASAKASIVSRVPPDVQLSPLIDEKHRPPRTRRQAFSRATRTHSGVQLS